jgi:hypothetical protein
MTFNLPPENAILSMSHDARRAYAMQLSTLLACPLGQTNSTPHPIPGAHWDRALLPHEPMEPPRPSYAWLALAADRRRSTAHRVLVQPWSWPGGPRAFDPSFRQVTARPIAGSVPPQWTVARWSADWCQRRPSPAICARIRSGWSLRRCCPADREICPAAPAKTIRLSAEERRARPRQSQNTLRWAKPTAPAISAISIDP